MKSYWGWGVEVYIHIFLTLAGSGDEQSASHCGCFIVIGRAPGEIWRFRRGEFLSLDVMESQFLACLTRSLVNTQTETKRMSVFVT
jgi:hypothetical protein